MKQRNQPPLSRRHLLAGAGTAGALAAAAGMLAPARQADPDAAVPKLAPEKNAGYQLTEHVLRYYQTTKV
jgi:hypothetical protein